MPLWTQKVKHLHHLITILRFLNHYNTEISSSSKVHVMQSNWVFNSFKIPCSLQSEPFSFNYYNRKGKIHFFLYVYLWTALELQKFCASSISPVKLWTFTHYILQLSHCYFVFITAKQKYDKTEQKLFKIVNTVTQSYWCYPCSLTQSIVALVLNLVVSSLKKSTPVARVVLSWKSCWSMWDINRFWH